MVCGGTVYRLPVSHASGECKVRALRGWRTMVRRTSYVVLTSCVVAGTLAFMPALLGQADPTSVGFIGPYKTAAEKKDPSKLPIIGAWRINLAKSDPGIQPRFTSTGMKIFIAENGGIRQVVYQPCPRKVKSYKPFFRRVSPS